MSKLVIHYGTGTYFDIEDMVYIVDTADIHDDDEDTVEALENGDPTDAAIKYGENILNFIDIDQFDIQLLVLQNTTPKKGKIMEPITPQVPPEYNPQASIMIRRDGHFVTLSALEVEAIHNSFVHNTQMLGSIQSSVSSLQEYIEENYESIDGDFLDELVTWFDLDLEKSVTVTATVEFEMQVLVPLREMDEFEVNNYDFEFEVTSYSRNIERSDATVTDWRLE